MRSARSSTIVNSFAARALVATLALAVATPVAAAPKPASPAPHAANRTHCLDSFLAVGQPVARPLDIALQRVSNPKPDFVIRIDLLVAPKLPKTPLVGFLYFTRESTVFFSTRERARIDPAVTSIVRELYAASTTATSAQLDTLLARQNGNAVVFLPRALRLLRSLHLRTAPLRRTRKDGEHALTETRGRLGRRPNAMGSDSRPSIESARFR
jgi:hypothetical protein